MANYRDYVVCIEKRCGEGENKVLGTGFPVTEKMVLTAKHVVEGIEAQELELKPFKASGKNIHYFGDGDDNDYAVVELEDSLKQFSPFFFLQKKLSENQYWSSFGFPLTGSYEDEDGKIVDRGIGLKGQVYGAQSDSCIQQLQEDGSCAPELWKGVSGAPVMINQSKLAGIILNADIGSKGKRLDMLCSFHMLDNKEFCELCKINERANKRIEEALEQLNEYLLNALQKSTDLLKNTIVKDLKEHSIELTSMDERVIVDALCYQCEHYIAIGAINAAYREARDQSDQNTMRDARVLSGYIASRLLGSTGALRVAESGVSGVVDIAVPNSTLAEACMACLDGRPAEYLPNGSLTGKLAIPAPPESATREPLLTFREVLEELREKFLAGSIESGEKLTDEDTCLYVNGYLKKRKRGTKPQTHYFVLPAGTDALAEKIEKNISELVCLRLLGRSMDLDVAALITTDLRELNQSEKAINP